MRVLCIKSSVNQDPEVITVAKGSHYHITKVVKKKTNYNSCNIWYELLETGVILHNATLFVVAPDEDIKEEKIEKEQIQIKSNIKSVKLEYLSYN